jgi:hypothetical protein
MAESIWLALPINLVRRRTATGYYDVLTLRLLARRLKNLGIQPFIRASSNRPITVERYELKTLNATLPPTNKFDEGHIHITKTFVIFKQTLSTFISDTFKG